MAESKSREANVKDKNERVLTIHVVLWFVRYGRNRSSDNNCYNNNKCVYVCVYYNGVLLLVAPVALLSPTRWPCC